MKKIDFHVHTVKTFSDSDFEFDIDVLKNYINEMNIDAIAITNHNLFDIKQYNNIIGSIPNIVIFPGIELNIGNNCGHMILIDDPKNVLDFNARCMEVEKLITDQNSSINVENLKRIFIDLGRYLLIPHYNKKPCVDKHILEELKSYIFCGEVNSIKKFIYNIKGENLLTPVYFSDMRAKKNLSTFPIRQTFFDLDDINLDAIKLCLRDKSKVSLTKREGHKKFVALPNLELSTGLNVIIGGRSSGKSHTLDEICKRFENVKYIRQFSLLEMNEKKAAQEFTNKLNIKRGSIAKKYFSEFSTVVDDVKDISLENDITELEKYLSSLIEHASQTERADIFSKCLLYSESEFQTNNLNNIKNLIKAVEMLLDTTEYRSIVNKYIDRETLIKLHYELIKKFVYEEQVVLKKRWINDAILSIKNSLQSNTAAPRIQDVDFYKIQSNQMKINKFKQVVYLLKKPKKIHSKDLEKFKIEVRTKTFNCASDLGKHSGKKLSFSNAFKSYDDPYMYLKKLRDIEALDETTYYQYFMNVEFKILNKYGYEVSGGERAEFNLLKEINDAYQYDLLLIDEPESSFDNLFLKDSVNSLLKLIAQELPVIIVTHNNTVGASIKPDYIVYTKRDTSNSTVNYKIYSGYPSDKYIVSESGDKIKNIDATLNCLEAGENAYDERRYNYEILKD